MDEIAYCRNMIQGKSTHSNYNVLIKIDLISSRNIIYEIKTRKFFGI